MANSLPKYGTVEDSKDVKSGRRSLPRPSGISITKPIGATPTGLTLNIITGGLGTGILSLPWSTAGASLVPALVTIAVVLAVNKWTIMILVECADRFQIFDLGGLLSRLPGTLGFRTQAMCNVTVWISMFMCLMGYMIAISDSFLRAIGKHPGNPEDPHVLPEQLNSPRTYVLMVAACIIAPLCFLDQKRLAFTSSVAVCVNVYIFILLAGFLALAHSEEAPDPPLPSVCYVGLGKGTIAMIAAMMQAVIIQMCVLPMYEELQDRTPETFNKILNRGFSSLFGLFALFSTLGYLRWGNGLNTNVLINLPRTGITGMFANVAQVGMVIVCCGVYPIMMSPMIAPLRTSTTLKPWAGLITVGIVMFSSAAALTCTLNKIPLGTLNVVNGSLCAGVFVGIVPALVGIEIMGRNKFVMTCLAAIGVVIGIAGITWPENYAKEVMCLHKIA